MSEEPTVSALMPVHQGVRPEHLREALQSILDQTRRPDELVIVEDGPLTLRHLEIIHEVASGPVPCVRVQLTENSGAGQANQAGLEIAMGEWILKADADDVNDRHRLATQLEFALSQQLDVCGSAMLEFDGSPDNVVSIRRMPLDHRAISRRMSWNNPINHPTALYRRDSALAAGGYPPWRYMQDYGLFARMIATGAVMANLTSPLVLFRTSLSVTRRRRSVAIIELEATLQSELLRLGLVGAAQMRFNIAWRKTYRRLPSTAISSISRRVLAQPVDR